ncbi:MAG: hypothetical protein QM758_17380 [Armatimonas sp.]
MHKPFTPPPAFPKEAFLARISPWKKLLWEPGSDRIVIEWGIGQGPKVIVYPAAARAMGFNLLEGLSAPANDERWADYLEEIYLPQVAEAVENNGGTAQIICADQRPIQVMRTRRRAQESVAHARGAAH